MNRLKNSRNAGCADTVSLQLIDLQIINKTIKKRPIGRIAKSGKVVTRAFTKLSTTLSTDSVDSSDSFDGKLG
ncbi:MAG: hypothetical protein HQL57_01840 [Magnetococcales bacterium]|nr:hypothetical protein [Magnetococcales bacterium]MBF0155912.1 hypothetical protein [Magnetococcales bacterium]